MVLDRLLDLLAHRFLCFSSIFLRFSYSYVRQTSWPALWSTFGRTKYTPCLKKNRTRLLCLI